MDRVPSTTSHCCVLQGDSNRTETQVNQTATGSQTTQGEKSKQRKHVVHFYSPEKYSIFFSFRQSTECPSWRLYSTVSSSPYRMCSISLLSTFSFNSSLLWSECNSSMENSSSARMQASTTPMSASKWGLNCYLNAVQHSTMNIFLITLFLM